MSPRWPPEPGRPSGPDVFLPYRGLDWTSVRRARFYAQQRFEYRYPAPISNLSHRLMVLPPGHLGDQTLLRSKLHLRPRRLHPRRLSDRFGNAVIEVEAAHVRTEMCVDVTLLVERRRDCLAAPISAAQAALYARPTLLTTPDAALTEVAGRLRARARSQAEFALRVSDFVAGHMRYASGVTGVHTAAAEAYALGAGLCQDYTHIALALCRAGGLSARYVSGHMPGEGSSHAWFEALPRGPRGYSALALDPTNARAPHLGYAVIAHGNDYRDVAPTAGQFRSSQGGALTYSKQAGLVELEFEGGERQVVAVGND